MSDPVTNLGISGRLTRAFIVSPLTPLLLLASIIVGVIALIALPREEEPQISVPMVDIVVPANGYKAADAVELVTRPLEEALAVVPGVRYVRARTIRGAAEVNVLLAPGVDPMTRPLTTTPSSRTNDASGSVADHASMRARTYLGCTISRV